MCGVFVSLRAVARAEEIDRPRRIAAVVVLCTSEAATQPNDGCLASRSIMASTTVFSLVGLAGSCRSCPSCIGKLFTR